MSVHPNLRLSHTVYIDTRNTSVKGNIERVETFMAKNRQGPAIESAVKRYSIKFKHPYLCLGEVSLG